MGKRERNSEHVIRVHRDFPFFVHRIVHRSSREDEVLHVIASHTTHYAQRLLMTMLDEDVMFREGRETEETRAVAPTCGVLHYGSLRIRW